MGKNVYIYTPFSVQLRENVLLYFPALPAAFWMPEHSALNCLGFAHRPLTAFSSPPPSDLSVSSWLSVSDPGLHTSQANIY